MKAKALEGQKVLIFVENIYEDLELLYPRYRLMEEGAKVIIAGPKAKETYNGKHGYPCQADISFQDIKTEDYQALIIPGGYAPDRLRRHAGVLECVQQFHQKAKLIAFICHAGWVPISAKVIDGIRCTSFSAIKDDMINAGALWVDEAVVVDRHFISSRTPEDLTAFCPAIIEFMVKKQ